MNAQNIRQRLEQFIIHCGFKLVTQNEDKLSHYYEIRHRGKLQMSVIRISNHCTSPLNWINRYGSYKPSLILSGKQLKRLNGNYNGLPSKYFNKSFYSIVIFDPNTDGMQQDGNVQDGNISVFQNTYNANQMTNESFVEIENKIKQIVSNNTLTEKKTRPRIRLTEGDLHRIIRNCVNEALYVLGTSSM